MSTSFFIEFRLQGYARKYAKWASTHAIKEARRCRVKKLKQRRFVPHITLFGPARTNNLKRVVNIVERIGRKYTLIPFKIGGFDKFENPDAYWLYLSVHPSSILEQFRHELAQNLLKSEGLIRNTCQPYDRGGKYKFHSAVGKYSPRNKQKFRGLFDCVNNRYNLEAFRQHRASFFERLIHILKKCVLMQKAKDPKISLYLLRITILGKRSRIKGEYDLVLRKMLSRREALSKSLGRRSIDRLKAMLNQGNKHSNP